MEPSVLEEDLDPNYEPSSPEIQEYAVYIGLDPSQDSDLLYIAREGLKAPLPVPWKPCETQDGAVFYFNFETQESLWEHPCDLFYKERARELKAAKAKRRGNRSALSPQSAGNAPKESRETAERRKELDRLKAADQKQQEKELTEFKSALQRQLEEAKALRSDTVAANSESARAIQAKEEERLRKEMQVRLLGFKAALSRDLEAAKSRMEAEKVQNSAKCQEEVRKSAAETLKSQTSTLDLELKTLEVELQSLQEAEKDAISGSEREKSLAQAKLKEQQGSWQQWKGEKLKEEMEKERIRYERLSEGIRTALEDRIRNCMGRFAAPEELGRQETEVRCTAEAKLQQDLEALNLHTSERIHTLRRDFDQRLEAAREKAQEQQRFLANRDLEEQKKVVDLQAAQELIAYQRSLDRQLDAEKREMEIQFRREEERGKGEKGNREEEELREDGEVRLLTLEVERAREVLALKQTQLRNLRELYEEMKRKKPERQISETNRLRRMESDLRSLKAQVLAQVQSKPLSSKPSHRHIPSPVPNPAPHLSPLEPLSDFEELRRKTQNQEWPRSIQPLMEQKVQMYSHFLSEETSDRARLQALLGRQTEWVTALRAALV